MQDPSKNREERRKRAKEAREAATDEELEELTRRHRPAPKPRAEKAWKGSIDAVSLPIDAEHGAEPFMTGENNDWFFPAAGLPRQLRIGGWLYLRSQGRLVARATFLGPETRTTRVEHIASPNGFTDHGPGPVLKLDPNSWEVVDVELEADNGVGNGYRYYDLVDDVPVSRLAGG